MTEELEGSQHEGRRRLIVLLEAIVRPARGGIAAISPFEVVASGLTIALLVAANDSLRGPGTPLLIPPFAASIGVLYTQRGRSTARSWNVIFGQLLGGISGFLAITLVGSIGALSAGLAVAAALALMQLTHSLHPPALGTALLVVLVPAAHGARFLVFPILAGAVFVVIVAKLVRFVELRILSRLERALEEVPA